MCMKNKLFEEIKPTSIIYTSKTSLQQSTTHSKERKKDGEVGNLTPPSIREACMCLHVILFHSRAKEKWRQRKRSYQTIVPSLSVYYSPTVEGPEGIPSQKGRSRRVHNNVPKRVCNVPTTSMLNKLSWREEVSMAHTHDPHFLPFTIFVQDSLNSSSIRAISFCKHTRHVSH